jgi:hypothetical protein
VRQFLHRKRKYCGLRAHLIAPLLLLVVSQSSFGQGIVPAVSGDTTTSFFNRRNVITYGIVAHTVFTTYVEYQWWWKGDYHPFHYRAEGFLNDYSLGVDKMGHFYTSHFYFTTLYNLMKWGGYDESTNLWASTLIPALYALSIEIGDGYSTYQFAPDDLTANLLGVGYGLLQVKYPFFKNFKVKWSYFPGAAYRNSFKHPFSDDYDDHIYWLSMNVQNLLPESMGKYWPRFLNVAVGYGGKNISTGAVGPSFRKVAIALDYNLTTIPLEGETWDVVKNIVDLFHFPSPGVRIIEGQPAEFKPLLLN